MNKKTKSKFLKAFVSLSAFGLISIIPLSIVSCSNSHDTSKNTPLKPQQEFVPQINSNIQIVGDFSAFNKNDASNDLIKQKIVSKQNLQNLIKNINDYSGNIDNLKIDINIQNDTNNLWGTIGYETWKQTNQKIYLNLDANQITFGSLNDLYNLLSNQNYLMNLIEQTNLVITNQKVSLVSTSNIGIEQKLIHINIAIGDTANKTTYDLCIPTSSIIYKPITSVSISGNNVKTIKQNINLSYIQGIDYSTTFYNDSGVDIAQNQKIVDIDNAIQAMGWGEIKVDKATNKQTLVLNSNKIGEDLKIFNTDFFDPVLIVKGPTIIPTNLDYTGLFQISFKAKPKQGYFWNDNTNQTRTIVTGNILFNLKDSIIVFENSWKNQYGLVAVNFGLASPDGYPKTYNELVNFVQQPTTLNKIRYTLEQNSNPDFSNISFGYISLEWNDYYSLYTLTLKTILNPGHTWSDNSRVYSQILFKIDDIKNKLPNN